MLFGLTNIPPGLIERLALRPADSADVTDIATEFSLGLADLEAWLRVVWVQEMITDCRRGMKPNQAVLVQARDRATLKTAVMMEGAKTPAELRDAVDLSTRLLPKEQDAKPATPPQVNILIGGTSAVTITGNTTAPAPGQAPPPRAAQPPIVQHAPDTITTPSEPFALQIASAVNAPSAAPEAEEAIPTPPAHPEPIEPAAPPTIDDDLAAELLATIDDDLAAAVEAEVTPATVLARRAKARIPQAEPKRRAPPQPEPPQVVNNLRVPDFDIPMNGNI